MKYYYVDTTDYGITAYHNLGDFVYSLCLDNFLKLHNVEYSTIRKDLIGKFKFNPEDVLIMAGYFPGIKQDISVHASCSKVKYIGFHYNNVKCKKIPSIIPENYIGNFGCRDFGTYKLFQRKNPNCYVSLCASLMSNMLDFNDMKCKRNKTIFVDCPNDFVKKHWDKDSETMTHWIKHLGRNNAEMCKVAYDRLKYYKEHAKIIYTTKLHVYLPCIAMKVPVKYIGSMNYRTEIVNAITPDTIDNVQPLVVQNFEYEIFGTGEDVHMKLHNLVMNTLS